MTHEIHSYKNRNKYVTEQNLDSKIVHKFLLLVIKAHFVSYKGG